VKIPKALSLSGLKCPMAGLVIVMDADVISAKRPTRNIEMNTAR
jgi:hypothetical protein